MAKRKIILMDSHGNKICFLIKNNLFFRNPKLKVKPDGKKKL